MHACFTEILTAQFASDTLYSFLEAAQYFFQSKIIS